MDEQAGRLGLSRARHPALSIVTIGVYEWDLDSFLTALAEVEARALIDVRQRRAVRGPRYAWANSRRLQRSAATAGLDYRHRKELAPTTELRQLQYAEDARQGVGKRSRVALAPAYVERYTREILGRVDLAAFVRELPAGAVSALMCVERDPEACHRSLIAEHLANRFGTTVRHLVP